MKKTVIAIALAAMAPLSANADLLFTVGTKASVWNAEAGGQVDDTISVEDDGLNIDSEKGMQLTVFFEHPVPVLPNFKIKQTNLDMSGSGVLNIQGFLDDDVDFNNEEVDSVMDLSHTDFTMYWGLPLPIPFVDIDFGLTARKFDGVVEAIGKDTNTRASEDLDATLPMGYGAINVTTPFGLYASADINYISLDGNKLSDVSYAIGYDLPIPVVDLGIEGGYRSMNLKTDEDSIDLETDVDVSGAFVGASLSVGF